MVLATANSVPDTPSHGWWVAALRFPDAIRASAAILAVAAVFGLGIAIERFRRPAGSEEERSTRLPTLAICVMGLGVLTSVFVWFLGQTDLPPSHVSIPNGQTIEAFPAIETGSSFKVMLPTHVKLLGVEPEAGKATLELRGAGEKEGVRNDLFVGDPLEIGDFRFALIGLEYAPAVRAAVLTKTGGIDARGTAGGTVRFTPDGPEYNVRQIVTNYLGFMGPAAQLVDPDDNSFWVFQRENELDDPLFDIALKRVETAPVAVFSVAATSLHRYSSIGAVLLIVGLAMLILVSDRSRDSLSELGPRLEEDA